MIRDEIKTFKSYSDILKKGKCEPGVELENWVNTNVADYPLGRSAKRTTTSRAELSQWYIIYKVLAPQTQIPEHPCKLNSVLYPSAVDILLVYDHFRPCPKEEETLMVAFDSIIDRKIISNGPPLPEHISQRDWYRDALRDALKAISKTSKRAMSASPDDRKQEPIVQCNITSQSPNIMGQHFDIAISQPHSSHLPVTQSIDSIDQDPDFLPISSPPFAMDNTYDFIPDIITRHGNHAYEIDQMEAQVMDFGEISLGPTDCHYENDEGCKNLGVVP